MVPGRRFDLEAARAEARAAKRAARIRAIASNAVLALVLLALAGGGWYGWRLWQERRAAQAAEEQAARDAEARAEAERQRAEAAREAKMKAARDKCLAEISEEEGKDFVAAYREHISKDAFLKNLIDHTELGCSPAFIRLIALAGATLRVEKGAPASAAAGSSLHDTDQGVFEATVPKHLR